MPKAARRQSGPKTVDRAEPYPTIRPGDKLVAPKQTKPKKTSPKALADKTPSDVNVPSVPSTESKKTVEKPAHESGATSFLDIILDGEPQNRVPIYDTCSVIRGKITALLGKDNAKPENGIPGEFKKDGAPKPYTKARFVKDIGDCSTRSMDTFMKAKRIMGGAESPIYPAAYVFFEKKAKSAGRKKTEEE